MVTIGISEFRANMNKILLKVQDGEIVSLTLRGSEIAKLVPSDYSRVEARQALKRLGKTAVINDILTPVENEDDWHALQ